jgi:hypothetical protein
MHPNIKSNLTLLVVSSQVAALHGPFSKGCFSKSQRRPAGERQSAERAEVRSKDGHSMNENGPKYQLLCSVFWNR